MANRRMFAKSIIDTDYFLEMPATSQLLYFHLSMRADDDGFISSPKRILRLVGSSDGDMKVLIDKRFIIPFESGICVITHWRIHNLIRTDRYSKSIYTDEKARLKILDNNSYGIQDVIPNVIPEVIPSVNPVKYSIGKDSIVKDNIGEEKVKKQAFSKPDLYEVVQYCDERNNNVDCKKFIDFYEAKGWMIGKNKMKDWKAAVRTWESSSKPVEVKEDLRILE